MAKPKVKLTCETHADISLPEIGERLLAPVFDQLKLAPDKVAHSEPIKQDFGSLSDLIGNWWARTRDEDGVEASPSDYGTNYHSILLKRSRTPTHWISVNFCVFTALNTTMPARLSLEAQWHPEVDYELVLRTWCEEACADFGMLHIFADAELTGFSQLLDSLEGTDEAYELYRNFGFFRSGLFMSPTWQKLNNLGWAQFTGEDQLRRIDLVEIENAGFEVRRHKSGATVFVSSDLRDIVDDFGEFSKRRALLKAAFPREYFHIDQEPPIDHNA